ncbi:histone methyltransferase set1, partial [Coemansia spiralis]
MSPLVTAEKLRAHFAAFGAVGGIRLGYDPSTGMSLGVARVEFAVAVDAPHPRVAASEALQSACVFQPGQPAATLTLDTGGHFDALVKALLDGIKEQSQSDAPAYTAPAEAAGVGAVRVPRSSISFSQTSEGSVWRYFERFRPAHIVREGGYWYILFASSRDAHRCQRLSDRQRFAGRIIDVELYEPADQSRLADLGRLAVGGRSERDSAVGGA